MKTRAALVLAVLGGGAVSAFGQAQTQGNVTYTLSSQIFGSGPGSTWTAPVTGGNGDAVVDPGEGVVFRVTIGMSLTPGGASGNLGSPLTWAPTIQAGSSGTGSLAGFWGGDLNLVGDAGAASAAGSWSDSTSNYANAVKRRLLIATAGGGSGIVNGNGSGLTDIQPAQFNADAEGISHSNNFITFTALWIPSSYSNRTVSFALGLGSLGLQTLIAAADNNYDNGYVSPVALRVTTSYAGTPLTFNVVPSPSSLALLGLGGLVAGRRRR